MVVEARMASAGEVLHRVLTLVLYMLLVTWQVTSLFPASVLSFGKWGDRLLSIECMCPPKFIHGSLIINVMVFRDVASGRC